MLEVDTSAPQPLLFNLSMEMIERFRRQVKLIDLQFEGDPEAIRQAVWSCYQEEPVQSWGYRVYDPGAYPQPPLSGLITWRIIQPWAEPTDEREREPVLRAKELIERLRARTLRKRK